MECAECSRNDPGWATFKIGCEGCIKREWSQVPANLRRALKIVPDQTRGNVIVALALVRRAAEIARLATREEVVSELREHLDKHGRASADRLKAEVIHQRQQHKESAK